MSKNKLICILGIILLLMSVSGYLGYELFLQKKETRQQENKEKKIKASRVLPDRKKYVRLSPMSRPRNGKNKVIKLLVNN